MVWRGGHDAALLERFENCDLEPEELDHATHIRIAWAYVRRDSLLDSLRLVSEGLRRFTKLHGAEDKYHETVTGAFVLLIQERVADLHPEHVWEDFVAANPDLFVKSPSPLDAYYRAGTLESSRSRRSFVLPELGGSPARGTAGRPISS